MLVVYSLAGQATVADIRKEVAPLREEPSSGRGSTSSSHGSGKILREKNIQTVILVGTAAHGPSSTRLLEPPQGITGHCAGRWDVLHRDLRGAVHAWHLVNGQGLNGKQPSRKSA